MTNINFLNKWGGGLKTNMEKCKIEKCNNSELFCYLELNFFAKKFAEYFPNFDLETQKKELEKLKMHVYTFGYCKNHLINIYFPLLKDMGIFNFLVPCSNEAIEEWFFDFLLQNITKDNWMRYYSDNKGIDILKPSLSNIIDEINENKNDSEIRWFNELTHYLGIPEFIRKNYILKEYIGSTKNQGKFHGPDFILENIITKETLGLEIVELNPLMFHFNKGIKNPEKILNRLNKQINEEKGGNFYRNFINLVKTVENKIDKWKNFQITDKKAIGIILNNKIPDIWYYIFELSLKMSKFKDFFDYFFIL